MICLLVESGVVINSAVFDEVPNGWVAQADGAGIDWTDNGDGTFTAPPKPPEPPMTDQDEIDAIERTITIRRLREAILTPGGKGWLQAEENKIEALRNRP